MQKISTDKSYRESLHRIVIDHIPKDVVNKNNRLKLWKYGYNEEYDVVVISKDGTIGEIVNIEGLYIALPSKPTKIINDRFQEKHQKWTRELIPDELLNFDKYVTDDDDYDKKLKEVHKANIEYIKSDINKIINGDWFMCDGKVMYITGYNYFFLQHYKLSDFRRYPDFREPQRDYFLWIEACIADNRCLGSLYLKNRRSFFSVCSASIVLCSSIRKKNGDYPIVSKTEKDAGKLFTKHIVKPFNTLSKHLQPQRVGEVSPKKELHFIAPKRKMTANNGGNSTSDGLDTIITYLASVIDAYDGSQPTISLNDEVGKMKGCNINDYWEQSHKMCHSVGGLTTGKALVGSTANPPNQGGANYLKFYTDSKLKTRGEIGETGTGLYAIFIKADLMQMYFYDEYGYAVVGNPDAPIKNEVGNYISMGTKEYLDKKENACGKDIKKLNSRKRNHPRVDTDAFLDEDASAMFGTEGMDKHKHFLNNFKYNPKYEELVFRFDLTWVGGVQDSTVKMIRNKNGRFQCSWLPPMEVRNIQKIRDGNKYPVNNSLGAFGCDPYDADRTRFKGSSMLGFVGLTTDDTYNLIERDRNKMFLRYNYRANTVEEAEEDIIMAMVYFSMPILPETNKKGLVKTLKERGYRKYVINNPLKLKTQLSPDDLKYGGISSHHTNISEQQHALKSWIYENVPSEIDENNLKVPFVECIEDAELYTRENRQQRDGTVAWMYAVLATTSKEVKKETKHEEVVIEQDIYALFSNN